MNIKAIVMDLDGTLLNDDKKISPLTKKILLKAQACGTILIIATGRPTVGAMSYVKELQLPENHGLLVCYNGSKVIDCHSGEEIYSKTLTIDQGKAVLRHMEHFTVYPMIDDGEHMYVRDVYEGNIVLDGKLQNIIQLESRCSGFKLSEVDNLADFLNFRLDKILIAGTPSYLEANYQLMSEPFAGKLNCTFSSAMYYEFTANGVDKGSALQVVLPNLGIDPKQVIAFGDGHNDKAMLELVKYGVAMGNAVSELKQVADDITLSNNEEGIAEYLLRYLN